MLETFIKSSKKAIFHSNKVTDINYFPYYVCQVHEDEYPQLSSMARDFLAVSGTEVQVERMFSSGADVFM